MIRTICPGFLVVCLAPPASSLAAAKAKFLGVLKTPVSRATKVVFSPDSRALAGWGWTPKPGVPAVGLWSPARGGRLAQLPVATPAGRFPPAIVEFSADGKLVVTAGFSLQLWQTGGRRLGSLGAGYKRGSSVRAARFSPDGTLLATTGELHAPKDPMAVTVWDVKKAAEVWTVKYEETVTFSEVAYPVDFSPDGKLLYVVNGKRLQARSAADGKFVATLGTLTSNFRLRDLRVSTNGKRAVVFRYDGLELWQLDDPRRLAAHKFGVGEEPCFAFAPGGESSFGVACVGLKDGSVHTWSLKTGKSRSFKTDKHEARVNSVAVTDDGRILASGSDDWTVKVWDAASGRVLETIEAGRKPVEHVDVADNLRYIAARTDDGAVRLWNIFRVVPR